MSHLQELASWFESQQQAGLQGMGVTILNMRGATVDRVANDILNLEPLATAGRLCGLPISGPAIAPEVSQIISDVRIGTV